MVVEERARQSRVEYRVGEGYSEEFQVKVSVHQDWVLSPLHQDSVLSPLLFIIVLEALSCEFRTGVPWEDLYADDLVIIAQGMCQEALDLERSNEEESIESNAGKTKIMICGMGWDLLQSSDQFPCAICGTGVDSNSIFCNGCKPWVHKKYSGLKH